MNNQRKIDSVQEFGPDLQAPMQIPQRSGFNVSGKVKKHKRNIIIILIALMVLGGLGFGVKTYLDLRSTKKELDAIKNNPDAKAKEDSLKLVEQVGKLVILPEGEDPTIATVTDPAKLADQPFFINSRTGDKVLIYQQSQRAILYRPSENKVIEIAPLTINDNSIIPDQVQNNLDTNPPPSP